MHNIEIGRYGADEAKDLQTGKGWIFFLDETGRAAVYFGSREWSGAVLEPRVHLVEPPAEQVCAA